MDETTNFNKNIKICIVALGAYPLFSNIPPINIIGPDVQQSILARELKRHDFDISIIVYGIGKPSIEFSGGIELIKIPEVKLKFRNLNILIKSLLIWNGMRKSKANIYLQPGGIPGVLSIYCKLFGKKYVYRNASDALVNRKLVTRTIREFSKSSITIGNFGYWLDMKLADAIIVQNMYQQLMLKKHFKKDGFLIKSIHQQKATYSKVNPNIVLWVGSIAEVKQPEIFLNLARTLPDVKFQMIGGHSSSNEGFYKIIRDKAKNIDNLEFLGVVPFENVDKYFGQASILVNTSIFEGFPNAFIQAWMHFVPVVSLNANPDNIISKYSLGYHSKYFDQMVRDVQTLLNNSALREKMGINGRIYFEREHDVSKNVAKYIKIFCDLVR